MNVYQKIEFSQALISAIISAGISYGIFLLSAFISTFIIHLIFGENSILHAQILIIILQISICIRLFKIKRLSKGASFLKKKGAGAIGCVISGIISLLYIMINRGVTAESGTWLAIGFALCIIGLITWWRHGITKQYREKVKERNVLEYEQIIADKELHITKLHEDNEHMAKIIHKNSKILPILSSAVIKFMESHEDKSDECEYYLDQIKQLQAEGASIINHYIHNIKQVPTTNIRMIDEVLNYMSMKASDNGIKFDVTVLNNFSNITKSTISDTKLQTLLSDLIENAIKATPTGGDNCIHVSFNINEGIYELCVQDSGVPFEIETLYNLGEKRASTRLNEGGSGIGYMTIFEILREHNASIIIIGHEPEKSGFTKSINIRFDNKAEYILNTFREKEILKLHEKTENILVIRSKN